MARPPPGVVQRTSPPVLVKFARLLDVRVESTTNGLYGSRSEFRWFQRLRTAAVRAALYAALLVPWPGVALLTRRSGSKALTPKPTAEVIPLLSATAPTVSGRCRPPSACP